MKKLIAYSIDHGKFFNFLALALTAAGMFVYFTARKDFAPPVEESIIVVSVVYPGASPETVRREIVSRIEEAVSAIFEIGKSSAVSKKNVGVLRFSVKRVYYKQTSEVLRKVQDKVDALSFPEIVRRPEYSINDYAADWPVISLHLAGGENLTESSRAVEAALRRVEGFSGVTVLGRQDYRYSVDFSPSKLAQRGIPLLEVMEAVRQALPDIPAGEILSQGINQNITFAGSLDSVEAVENIVIRANEALQPLSLKDLAEVSYMPAKKTALQTLDGRDGIVFKVTKTREADIIAFTDAIKKLIAEYQALYPTLTITPFEDNSLRVSARLNLLNGNLSYGLLLVFAVLFLFFPLTAAFWTVMGIPISFAFGAVWAVLGFGTTINMVSMMGFIIVVGVVVDDAIVFSENSYRLLEQGLSPREAVIQGFSEVFPAVFFAIATTIGTLICMGFIGGRLGDFAKPMLLVTPLTLAGSFLEAVFVLPSHLVHSFQKRHAQKDAQWRQTFFSFFERGYRRLLSALLTRRKTSFWVFTLGGLGVMGGLIITLPFVFFAGPPMTFLVHTETLPGTPIEQSLQAAEPLRLILQNQPNLEDVYLTVGEQGDSHKISIKAPLRRGTSPRLNWNPLKHEILASAKALPLLHNTRFYVLGEDNMGVLDLINITVKGTDKKAVLALAEEVRAFTAAQPNTQAPRLSQAKAGIEVLIAIDAAKAYAYGLTPQLAARHISASVEGFAPRTLIRDGREIDITLRYGPQHLSLETLSNLQIPNKYARFVRLSSLADISLVEAESEITTEKGLFSIQVTDTLADVLVVSNNSYSIQNKVRRAFASKGSSAAAVTFENEQKDTTDSLLQMAGSSALAVLVIFSMLLYLFNSYLHSIIILCTIPFIGVGLTVGLAVMGFPITNMALVGSITLLGMVVNDGIVILECLRTRFKEGGEFLPTLIDGSASRLRSIMMSTGTTALGIMPLAFGFAGQEYMLQPMAVAIMFGITFNSLINLILVPLAVAISQLDFGGSFLKSLKSSAWLLLLFLPLGAINAQEAILTEEDFLTSYLQRSFSGQIHAQSTLETSAASKAAFAPYAGSFFIQFSSALGTATNTMPIENFTLGGASFNLPAQGTFTNQSLSLGVDASIYPSGTYIKLEAGADFANQSSIKGDIAFAPAPSITTSEIRERYTVPYFQITLAQPFLKNGFAYGLHQKKVKLARREAGANLLQERLRLEESVLDALNKYHALLLNVHLLALRKESLGRLSALLERQRTLMGAGARSLWDVRQIEIQQKKLSAAVDILSIRLEKDFSELEIRLGLPLNRSQLGFLDHCLAVESSYTAQSIKEIALQRGSDLARVRLLSESASLGASLLRNQSLPELNLSISYKNAYRAGWENVGNASEDLFYAGLEFRMPLAFDTQRAKFLEARYRARRAELQTQNYESEISFAAEARFSDWQSLQRDLASKEEILLLTQRVADEARTRWQNSEISLNELFSHEETYRQAQIDRALTRHEIKRLALGLQLLQGTLLETYAVTTEF